MISQEEEKKIIQNIMIKVDGMSKIDIYDILYKIECLLFDVESTTGFNGIKNKILKSDTDGNTKEEFGSCYLYDKCKFLNLYKVKTFLPAFIVGEYFYFTVPWQLRLFEYTNANLIKAFKGTRLESVVPDFLKTTNANKRNSITKRLLFLELLDEYNY